MNDYYIVQNKEKVNLFDEPTKKRLLQLKNRVLSNHG